MAPDQPFELFQLRCAVLSAKYQSFNRAAQALGVRQITVSQHISRIEDVLGVPLFERSPRGAVPTEAGTVLARRARRILGDADELWRLTRDIGMGVQGRLRVGFFTSLSTGHLRATLEDYSREYPGITLGLMEDNRAALFHALDVEDIDIAIITGCGCVSGYSHGSVWSETVMAVLPRDHPLADRQHLQWNDLRGQTFVLSRHDPGPDFANMLKANLGAPGDPPDIHFHQVSRDTLFHMIEKIGIGITCAAAVKVLPQNLVARPLFTGVTASMLDHTAVWRTENNNPALRSLLELVERRHPSLASL